MKLFLIKMYWRINRDAYTFVYIVKKFISLEKPENYQLKLILGLTDGLTYYESRSGYSSDDPVTVKVSLPIM